MGEEGLFSDQAPALVRIGRAQQIFHPGVHEPGIGHIVLGIGKGQFHGFDLFVPAVHRLPLFQLESLHDVQGHQSSDPVAIGRNLPDIIASVIHMERFHPLGLIGG